MKNRWGVLELLANLLFCLIYVNSSPPYGTLYIDFEGSETYSVSSLEWWKLFFMSHRIFDVQSLKIFVMQS